MKLTNLPPLNVYIFIHISKNLNTLVMCYKMVKGRAVLCSDPGQTIHLPATSALSSSSKY